MAWVEIMLPSARTLPTGKLTQNPIRTGERRCILYVGDDSGITLAWAHATHPWTIGPLVVVAVAADSAGSAADLRVGDVLKQLDGRPVSRMTIGEIPDAFFS